MRNFSVKSTKWLNRGHELDYMASLIMRRNNEFYIVGNSNEIRTFNNRVGRFLADNDMIKGLVRTEATDPIDGIDIPIINDGDIPKGINTIIICTSFERTEYESVKQLFEGYGFEENRQFFQGEVFAMVYEVYALNKICIDRVEVFVTSHCPLKCEKCIAYIPFFKTYEHTSLEKLREDLNCLFSKVDFINKFKIVGGDGLVYPYLKEYVKCLGDKYIEKIGSIRIGTNGTIIPEDELLNICAEYDIQLDVSDYRCTINERSKLEDIIDKCESFGVKVDIKRTGEQWLDMGFPNKLPGKKDEEHLKSHYSKCAMFCRDFDDGKLYHCCSNFAAVKAGLFPSDENDYFDFRQEFSKKELLEYEIGFCNKGYTSFCEVCRGCSDEVNPFHTQVAKQSTMNTDTTINNELSIGWDS